jgi:hypothetical protein|tara:strand:- start:1766 stop:2170 length:405 start_codon:yes stop_codon:yes gene_type:complete
MNSVRKGIIGESFTKIDLIKRGLYPHKVELDDDGVDFIVESKEQKKTFTLQVKYRTTYDSTDSVVFDIKKTRADWVALVHEIKQPNGLSSAIVMYVKNKRYNKRWQINMRIGNSSNNKQTKLVHYWQDYINPEF